MLYTSLIILSQIVTVMTLTILFILLLIVVVLQPTRARVYTAAVFGQVAFFHDALTHHMEGGGYYIWAAAADVLVMILLIPVSSRCIVAYRITHLAFMSILLNVLGWLLWYNFYEPTVYDASFIVLYVCALITLIKRHGNNKYDGVGTGRRTGNLAGIRAGDSTGMGNSEKYEAAET